MNKLKVFKNNEFGEIRAVEINGEGWLVGKDIAEILQYKETHKAISRHVDKDDRIKHPVTDSLGRLQNTWIINESGFYSLVLSSEMKEAKEFKRWVTKEVLPSIRRHGAYLTDKKIEEVLTDPDTIIRLATKLKEERQKRVKAEKEVEHKREVIKGVTDNIDIYKKRNILNKVVRYKGANFSERWNELYDRFLEVYSINLKARCKGYNLTRKIKKDRLSVIKYAEKFGYIDNLYNIAAKLYETDINEILQHLRIIN